MKKHNDVFALIIVCIAFLSFFGCSKAGQDHKTNVEQGSIKPPILKNNEPLVRYDDFPDTGGILSQFVAHGNKWDHFDITYYFQSGTEDIAGDGEKQAFYEAFNLWAEVTPLTFSEVNSASLADIIILFESGDHGDLFPFDGLNGVLAHAFLPPPNGYFAGDAHFDDDESWTLSIRSSSLDPRDLVTVAAHEIGHSLGLLHSTHSGALMYPYYVGSRRYLHEDDVRGIQSIYGSRVPDDLVINNEVIDQDKTYDANKTISATNVSITGMAVVQFNAGEAIDLNSNFDISPGASFDATVGNL